METKKRIRWKCVTDNFEEQKLHKENCDIYFCFVTIVERNVVEYSFLFTTSCFLYNKTTYKFELVNLIPEASMNQRQLRIFEFGFKFDNDDWKSLKRQAL